MEKLLVDENRFTAACRYHVNEAAQAQQEEEKFKRSIERLLHSVAPFDIEKFRRLIVDYDAQIARVKNKHIYLLLGGTGVGKSTVIHYLSGSKARLSFWQTARGKLPHITFDDVSEDLDAEEREHLR